MNNLIEEIAELEFLLQAKKAALHSKMAKCQHEWGEIEAAHIFHPGYVLRGDPLDSFRPRKDEYIPPEKEERWRRKCLICGKEEFTNTVETEVITKRTPLF